MSIDREELKRALLEVLAERQVAPYPYPYPEAFSLTSLFHKRCGCICGCDKYRISAEHRKRLTAIAEKTGMSEDEVLEGLEAKVTPKLFKEEIDDLATKLSLPEAEPAARLQAIVDTLGIPQEQVLEGLANRRVSKLLEAEVDALAETLGVSMPDEAA